MILILNSKQREEYCIDFTMMRIYFIFCVYVHDFEIKFLAAKCF